MISHLAYQRLPDTTPAEPFASPGYVLLRGHSRLGRQTAWTSGAASKATLNTPPADDSATATVCRLAFKNCFGLGDIAVGSMLGFLGLRAPEITWRQDSPQLARLYDNLSKRESFASTVPVMQVLEDGIV